MGHRKSSKKYCEIRKCGIYDNKGFTLVELLVGIAILARDSSIYRGAI
mgnify:CR=1 FL=1